MKIIKMSAISINIGFSLICILILVSQCSSLHLKGRWKSQEFFEFLAKFGFQQTNMNDKTNTQGYIYGNITSRDNVSTSITFVVVDSEYFLQYYGNKSVVPRAKACPAMFNKIDEIAWDRDCNPNGNEDFLRKIPCPHGSLCEDEDSPLWVIPGYQFTYSVQDTRQPRYWYISMVSCSRNITNHPQCTWTYNHDQNIELDYDIWLVNGHPNQKHINPFEHQFSFDHHDTFEMYLIFFVAYLFLVPIQIFSMMKQKHVMPILLTFCMGMEFFGISFNLIHVFKFAFDGEGVELLKVVGNFIDNLAQCIFMLLLMLIVKGWTITRMELGWRPKVILFTVWGTYTVANMALFIWNLMEMDNITDIGEWQTWPGWLILGFRIAIMIWFLFELRNTVLLERGKEKTRFYLHFGAGFLVWFVYLPIIAVICTQISSLWRYKTILSVTYSADFVSYCVLVHLLWPSRSAIYFNLKLETPIQLNDLEYTVLGKSLKKTALVKGINKKSLGGNIRSGGGSDSEASLDLYDSQKIRLPSRARTLQNNGQAYMPLAECDSDTEEIIGNHLQFDKNKDVTHDTEKNSKQYHKKQTSSYESNHIDRNGITQLVEISLENGHTQTGASSKGVR